MKGIVRERIDFSDKKFLTFGTLWLPMKNRAQKDSNRQFFGFTIFYIKRGESGSDSDLSRGSISSGRSLRTLSNSSSKILRNKKYQKHKQLR